MEKVQKKNGISLIVLVITILVMIILAGVVVVTMSENNPIGKAKEANFKSNVSEFNSVLEIYHANAITANPSYVKSGLNVAYKDATGANATEKEKNHAKEMRKYIPDMSEEYTKMFDIVSGNLVYRGTNKEEAKWSEELGIQTPNVKLPAVSKESFIATLDGDSWQEYKGVVQTDDGGYIAVGSSASSDIGLNIVNKNARVIAVKYNAAGSEEWRKAYNPKKDSGVDNYGHNIAKLKDGNYVIVGYYAGTNVDHLIAIKISPNGELIWEKIFGADGQDGVPEVGQETPDNVPVIATEDGNILVGGGVLLNNNGGARAIVTKLNGETGAVIWKKIYTTTGDACDLVESANSYDVLDSKKICRFNKTTGEKIDETSVTATHSASNMVKLSDAEYAVVTRKNVNNTVTGGDLKLYKVNITTKTSTELGSSITVTPWGGAYSISKAADGNILLLTDGVQIRKINAQTGAVMVDKIHGKTAIAGRYNPAVQDNPCMAFQAKDGGIIISGSAKTTPFCGVTLDSAGGSSAFLLKLNSNLEFVQ